MCMFTGEIEYVSSTKIFSRVVDDRQALVYEMYLSTKEDTAMVLPIPISLNESDDLIEFIDLSDFGEIFGNLNDLFPAPPYILRATMPMSAGIEMLEVEDVGVYEVSFVPKMEDFSRLDPRFSLSSDVISDLEIYKDYGFVVFKLKAGKSKVHPMAFWFKTRDKNRLFFPTVHIHKGKVNKHDEFDHVLYAQGDVFQHPGLKLTKEPPGNFALNTIAEKSKGLVSADDEVYRQDFEGTFENRDIWFKLEPENTSS